MFIQLIFILFGLIQTEFIQQEFSPLLGSLVCAEYHSEDCGVFYVTTNIENIKVGDYVLTQDVETGEVSLKEVTDTIVRTSNHLRYLTTVDEEGDTQTIETTDAHPFWVVTSNPDLERIARNVVVENDTVLEHENLTISRHGYYVEAKDLMIGDTFIGANGELSTLTATNREEFPSGITVYNFSVEDNHNYYVIANLEAYENGASVVLVHNAKPSYNDDWVPATDTSKKVHNDSWGKNVPKTVPKDLSKEQLEQARDALIESTRKRQQDFATGKYPDTALNSAKNHGDRLQKELNLLHAIEARLRELR
jgi:hypothetical protein